MNKNEKEKLKWIKKEIQAILSYVAPEIMFDHFKQKIFPAIDGLIGDENGKWKEIKCERCNKPLNEWNIYYIGYTIVCKSCIKKGECGFPHVQSGGFTIKGLESYLIALLEDK